MLPPPYQLLVWDYKKSDPNNIRKALDLVNGEWLYEKKRIDAQVATFIDPTLNTSYSLDPVSM